ncbi:MAG: flippase [Candidatus Omnitrophica bacterium]|nr:flippase [Candidatus Omnitrophota bacterium]
MGRKIITPKEKKTVLDNFISLSTLQSINYILPVLVLPYLIRVIGPSKFGLIAFAQALIQYFIIFTDYGFSLTATRKISLCRNEKSAVSLVFSSAMTVKLLLAGLIFVILILLVNFVPRFKTDWLVYVLSFGAVIGNTLFPVWFFQGQEKMRFISIINITGGMIYAIAIFIFIKKPADYILVPVLNSAFFLITGILGLYTAFKKFDLEFIFQDYSNIANELKTGWSIFISVASINAYTATRIFAVGLLTNNILTGYYAIAEKIAYAFQTFPLDSFAQAIYPRLSHIFSRNKKRAYRLMNRIQDSTTLIFVLIIPLAILAAPLITRVICGVKYPEVITSLRILLIGVFFVAINAFRVQFLLVSGRPNIYSKIHVIAALLGVPLIFILIFYFSYLGSALSTVIIEAGILIATLKLVTASGPSSPIRGTASLEEK